MTNNKEIKDNKEAKENKEKQKNKAETKKQKVDPKLKALKEENKRLTEQIKNLINQVNELKLQNDQSISSFQEKAKGFQSKAQEEINRVKEELKEKTDKENAEFKKYGLQKTFENIIEPLLNIEVAIKAGKNQGDSVQAYVMGFEMLMQQLLNELEASGLTKISPEVGNEFDPELHVAFAKKEGDTNKILEVKKPGFKLYDRVIKPATVVIGE